MRQFGLDYDLRLRWYVEGDTAYGALKYIFGKYGVAGVGVINLRGQMSKGKVAAFRSSLREDLDAGVFGQDSIDADRRDTVRVVRQAAEDDGICGQVFVSEPDFEFHNFARPELEEVICRMIKDAKGTEVPLEDRLRLRRGIRKARNGDALLEQAKEALPNHSEVLKKGDEWGRHLMKYASEHPLWYGKDSSAGNGKGKVDRPIIEAVYVAFTARRSNYLLTRED